MKIRIELSAAINCGNYNNIRPTVSVEDEVSPNDGPFMTSTMDGITQIQPTQAAIDRACERIHDVVSRLWDTEVDFQLSKLDKALSKVGVSTSLED